MNRQLLLPGLATVLAAILLKGALLADGPMVVRATAPAPAPAVIPYPRDAEGGCGLPGARRICSTLTGDEGLCRKIRRPDISGNGQAGCRLELALPAGAAGN